MQVIITNDWFTHYDVKPYLEVGHTYDINELVHHKSWKVRYEAARHGYGLDVLVNDEYYEVRKAVARQGYGLDILVNDEDMWVRWTVAEQGYGLDILINDEDPIIREAVANQGYGLEILINDESSFVRRAVASQGYGLNVLVNDEDNDVRETTYEYLKEHGYKSVTDWAKANPDKVHDNIDTETTDNLKDFVYKVDDSNTLKAESSYESVEAFFDDNSNESYESNETLIILAVDTKVPLIKLEKSIKDEKQVYKFIVDITNEDGDSFNVKSIITSQETFSQLLQSTIESLSLYPQFNKYVSDLESCL